MTTTVNNLVNALSDSDMQEILDKLNSVEMLDEEVTLNDLDGLVSNADPDVCESICDVTADEMDAKCKEIDNRVARAVCRIGVKSWKAKCKKKCKKKA